MFALYETVVLVAFVAGFGTAAVLALFAWSQVEGLRR